MRSKRHLLPLVLLVASCTAEQPKPAPRPAPLPAPPPPQVVPPPAPPPPVPVAPTPEWQDLPLSAGSWSNSDGNRWQASFGAADPSFILRCDPQSRQVRLLRPGVTTGNVMTVRTSDARRTFPLSISPDPTATPFATLAADDPLLDSIAFSRGHFSIEVPGLPMLVIPAWPEPARVIQECRG